MSDVQESSTLMEKLVDAVTPVDAPLCAKYKRSFAFTSMKDRCPVILTKVVDYLSREKKSIIDKYGNDCQEEIKNVIGGISQLKNALQTAKVLRKFEANEPDLSLWNEDIDEEGAEPNYYETRWILAECYLYRQLREIFATQKVLKHFDYFGHTKRELLKTCLPLIKGLIEGFSENATFTDSAKGDVKKDLIFLIKCSLWANRVDLSITPDFADLKHDIHEDIESWDDYIVVNDIEKAVNFMSDSIAGKTIDIINDNSGLEFVSDLFLADFLITKFNVKKVNFRLKRIPWFVSDVTQNDFKETINAFCNHPDPMYQTFGNKWMNYLNSDVWSTHSDVYWTRGVTYAEMTKKDPLLYSELCDSALLIVKGDLNYRKLLQDVNWAPGTSFDKAIGSFKPTHLLALRTNKAETICGVDSSTITALNNKNSDWMVSGQYVVIHFY